MQVPLAEVWHWFCHSSQYSKKGCFGIDRKSYVTYPLYRCDHSILIPEMAKYLKLKIEPGAKFQKW